MNTKEYNDLFSPIDDLREEATYFASMHTTNSDAESEMFARLFADYLIQNSQLIPSIKKYGKDEYEQYLPYNITWNSFFKNLAQ